MKEENYTAKSYEEKYRQGYGLSYPESHIIRVHRHILEWELKMESGKIFDFGCGSGAHLKYFSDHGFVPYGCDVSATAITTCRDLMPEYGTNFFITATDVDLTKLTQERDFSIFLSNQVLYYLDNDGIRKIVEQAHDLVQSGGVFVVSMMAYSCWYARYITGQSGDFKIVDLKSPRQTEKTFINFKHREDLEELFQPFKKLHLGSYGSHIREEEGSTDHWLYVGIRE